MKIIDIIKLEPEAYLNPSLFVTNSKLENDEAFLRNRFEVGFANASQNHTVGVTFNGFWFSFANGVFNTTPDVIGKTPGTSAVLRGLLKGPARFCVYRMHKLVQKITTIKEIGEHLICDLDDISYVEDYNGIQIYKGVYKNIIHYFFLKNGRRRIFSSIDYTKQMIKYMEEHSEIF